MGLVLLIWPDKTLALLAALIGVWLCVVGIVRIVEAFVTKGIGRGARALTAVVGLLYLVIGIICLSNLLDSITVLAVVLGIVWVVGGVVEMIAALSRGSGWGKAIGPAARAAQPGRPAWCCCSGRSVSLTVLVWILGLWLLAIGIVQLILGFSLSRASRARTPPAPSPASPDHPPPPPGAANS